MCYASTIARVFVPNILVLVMLIIVMLFDFLKPFLLTPKDPYYNGSLRSRLDL
jgi:hypothetical protein